MMLPCVFIQCWVTDESKRVIKEEKEEKEHQFEGFIKVVWYHENVGDDIDK